MNDRKSAEYRLGLPPKRTPFEFATCPTQEILAGRDRSPLACSERVRSFLRDPQCGISRAQVLEDWEIAHAALLETRRGA